MISLVYVHLIQVDRMMELKDPFISVIVSDVRVTALNSVHGKQTHTHPECNTCFIVIFPFFNAKCCLPHLNA